MITGIEIENFKGIGKRVELELKPITLLFGPNSAGKSTILHALHYAMKIFGNPNMDAHETTVGEEHVDLGGFRQLVHNQDLTKEVKLRITASIDGGIDFWDVNCSEYPKHFRYLPENLRNWMQRAEAGTTFKNEGAPEERGALFGEAAKSVSVEIAVGWCEENKKPFVKSYDIWINGEQLGTIAVEDSDSDPDSSRRPNFVLKNFNYKHRILPRCFWRGNRPGVPEYSSDYPRDSYFNFSDDVFGLSELLDDSVDYSSAKNSSRQEMPASLQRKIKSEQKHEDFRQQSRLESEEFLAKECEVEGNFPYWKTLARALSRTLFENGEDSLHLSSQAIPAIDNKHFLVEPLWNSYEESVEWPDHITAVAKAVQKHLDDEAQESNHLTTLRHLSRTELEERIRGSYEAFALYAHVLFSFATKTIRSELEDFRYLGPFRKADYDGKLSSEESDSLCWASGEGAWGVMRRRGQELVADVGYWLSSPECLNSGYSLEFEKYDEVESESPLWIKVFGDHEPTIFQQEIKERVTELVSTPRLFIVPTGSKLRLRPNDVGVGISQVIPVLVSALHGTRRFNAIEQPELHVHPKMQTAIGDLLIHAFHTNANHFLIETHSEHLILRLLRRIRDTEKGTAAPDQCLRTDDLAVNYVRQEDGCCHVTRIDVDVKGEFIQPWPDDFFEIDFYERFPDAR